MLQRIGYTLNSSPDMQPPAAEKPDAPSTGQNALPATERTAQANPIATHL